MRTGSRLTSSAPAANTSQATTKDKQVTDAVPMPDAGLDTDEHQPGERGGGGNRTEDPEFQHTVNPGTQGRGFGTARLNVIGP